MGYYMDKYDEVYRKLFGEYFTDLRKSKGISRIFVAEKTGINMNTLACYEKGSRDCPLSVMKKLCAFYDLDFVETFRELNEICEKKTK